MKERKKRLGDRKDGKLVRNADTMHRFMPYILPNRADNEAVVTETVDLSAVNEYLAKKNDPMPDFKYTFFHVICAAIAKTIALRPKLNRFYAGKKLYERNELSLSFTAKRRFEDHSDEALCIVRVDPESDVSPLEQIHSKIEKFVTRVRKENKQDGATDVMDVLVKLPRCIIKAVVGVLRWLDYHGWYPKALMKDDPYYSTVFVSNLGSIKMKAEYHHLANWGTNSVFVIISEKKKTPVFCDDGSFQMKETLDLSITLDERIADGYYYAKSVKLLKAILEHPALLEESVAAVDETLKAFL